MRRTLRDFGSKARDAEVAVVYYAGHGTELDCINYLIPGCRLVRSGCRTEGTVVRVRGGRAQRKCVIEPRGRTAHVNFRNGVISRLFEYPPYSTCSTSTATLSFCLGEPTMMPSTGETSEKSRPIASTM